MAHDEAAAEGAGGVPAMEEGTAMRAARGVGLVRAAKAERAAEGLEKLKTKAGLPPWRQARLEGRRGNEEAEGLENI